LPYKGGGGDNLITQIQRPGALLAFLGFLKEQRGEAEEKKTCRGEHYRMGGDSLEKEMKVIFSKRGIKCIHPL